MANASAIRFVKNLVASFSRFPVTPETKERLSFKLSRWRFSDAHWERVLDIIIGNRKEDDRGLPELPEITGAINTLLSEQAQANSYATLFFNFKGYDYAERLVYRGSDWVSVRTGQFFSPPAGSTKELFYPDKQEKPDLRDLPTKDEVRGFMSGIQANLERWGKVVEL